MRLSELVENDRIVGGINKKSTKETIKFYEKFVNGKIFAMRTHVTMLEIKKKCSLNITLLNVLPYEL